MAEKRAIHDEVRTALDEWWAGIVPILGPRIKSVILSGSGAEGDYAPAVSDIDLYAVVDPLLQRSESGPVEAWHEPKEVTLRGRPGYWREIMTLQYLPPAMVSNPRDAFEYLSVRPRSTWWVTSNMSPFSRYTIIRHGYCYRGEPVTFAPPTEADLLDNIEREMNRWVAGAGEKLKDARWVADKVDRMERASATKSARRFWPGSKPQGNP